MESAFNRFRSRPEALLSTHEQGAAWDVITIDGSRNCRHYAETETIPQDVSDAAAKKAGSPARTRSGRTCGRPFRCTTTPWRAS